MADARGIRAGSAYVELSTRENRLVKGLNAAAKRLKAFGSVLTALGPRLTSLGTAVLQPLWNMAVGFKDSGDALNKMAARTGVSTEALSELGFAAEQSGADLETLEAGLRVMQRNLVAGADGSTQIRDALGKLGLSMAELKSLAPEEQFRLLADRLAQIGNPTLRAALAMDLFGKSGQKLVPLLSSGAKGIDELRAEAARLGLTVGTDQAQAAADLQDAWNRLMRTLKAVAFTLGSALAGDLTELLGVITRFVVGAVRWARENKDLVATGARVVAVVTAAGFALTGLGSVLGSVGTALGSLAGLLSGLGAAGGLLGGLINPLTLILAAAVALGLTLSRTGTTGGQALAWLGEQFGRLQQQATIAWQTLVQTLAGSDLAQAMSGLWQAVRRAAGDGLAWLTQQWQDVAAGLQASLAPLGQSPAEVFAGIGSTAAGLLGGLQQAAVATGRSLTAVFSSVAGAAQSAAGALSGALSGLSRALSGPASLASSLASSLGRGLQAAASGTGIEPLVQLWQAGLAGLQALFDRFARRLRGNLLVRALGWTAGQLAALPALLNTAGQGLTQGLNDSGLSGMFTALTEQLGRALSAVQSFAGALVQTLSPAGISQTLAGWKAQLGSLGQFLQGIAAGIGRALAGLGPLLGRISEGAGRSLTWLGTQLGQLRDTAVAAWQGLADALASGDIGLAARILWLTLQLEFQRGVLALEQAWLGLQHFLVNTYSAAVFSLAGLFNHAGAGMESAWVETVHFLALQWQNLMTLLQKAWSRFGGFFARVWARLQGLLSGTDVSAELDRIQAEETARDQNLTAAHQDLAGRREEQRRARQAAIEQQRLGLGEQLQQMQAGEADDRRRRQQAALQAGAENLAEAQRQWQEALDQARAKRLQADAGGGPAGKKAEIPTLDEVVDTARARVDVQGSFNALAVRGLGADSLSERATRAAEQTAANTRKLLQEARHGGLVFA